MVRPALEEHESGWDKPIAVGGGVFISVTANAFPYPGVCFHQESQQENRT